MIEVAVVGLVNAAAHMRMACVLVWVTCFVHMHFVMVMMQMANLSSLRQARMCVHDRVGVVHVLGQGMCVVIVYVVQVLVMALKLVARTAVPLS